MITGPIRLDQDLFSQVDASFDVPYLIGHCLVLSTASNSALGSPDCWQKPASPLYIGTYRPRFTICLTSRVRSHYIRIRQLFSNRLKLANCLVPQRTSL